MKNTIFLTLGQAAEMSTASKSTLHKALKKGDLGSSREGKQYRIDPVELERWENTRVTRGQNNTPRKKQNDTPSETPLKTHETALLNQEILHLQEKLAMLQTSNDDLRNERDDWKGQAKVLAITDQSKRTGFFGWLKAKN